MDMTPEDLEELAAQQNGPDDPYGVNAPPLQLQPAQTLAPAPKPVSAPVDPAADKEFDQAQFQSNLRRLASNGGTAQRIMLASAGIHLPDDTAAKQAWADSPLSDLKAKRGMLQERLQAKAMQDAANERAAQHDASDPRNKLRRDLLAKMMGVDPSSIDPSLAGSDVDTLAEKYGTIQATKAAHDQAAQKAIEDRLARREDRESERTFRAGESEKQRDLLRELAAERAAGKIDLKHGQDEEKQLQALSKQLPPEATGFADAAFDANDVVERHPDHLPGVGPVAERWAGLKEKVGIGNNQDTTTLMQRPGQMLQAYRKAITGTGMGEQERQEFAKYAGMIEGGSEQARKQGLNGLARLYQRRVQQTLAGYPESVRQKYLEQNPTLGRFVKDVPKFGIADLAPKDATASKLGPGERIGTDKKSGRKVIVDQNGKPVRWAE